MRKVAIVGAGQAGLQLAIGLQKYGFAVSLFSDRTARQIQAGKIMSSQGIFESALKYERELGLNFWDDTSPRNESVTFSLGLPQQQERAIYWQGKTDCPFQSIDQRLKFSRWMDEFEHLGGNLYILDVSLTDLNAIAIENDLTIVSTGKNTLSQHFPTNNERSYFNKPQRKLSCIYVNDAIPAEGSPGVRANIIPGIGEYCVISGLTFNGACEMMLFEGIPNGPFDCWQTTKDIKQQLSIAQKLLKEYVPWEYERFMYAKPTDNQAGLIGGYTPTVRNPYLKLPCGKYAFGIGDAAALNDPIAGQGANSAAKAAKFYMDRIIEHQQFIFDRDWMEETFEAYWYKHAKWATQWTQLLLLPPPPHIIELLSAASHSRLIANIIANAFDEPASLFPWIMSEKETLERIAFLKKEQAEELEKI